MRGEVRPGGHTMRGEVRPGRRERAWGGLRDGGADLADSRQAVLLGLR